MDGALVEIRGSILAALGLLAIGCGPSVSLESDGDGDEGNDGAVSSSGTASDDDSAPTSDDADDDADDDGSGTATADADDGSTDFNDDGPPTAVCADGVPILQNGVDGSVPTGFDRCGDGSVVRASVVACDQPQPLGRACTLPEQSCSIDADCTDGAFGRCIQQTDLFEGQEFCGCAYGCEVDSDCNEGQLCACGGDGAGYPAATRCVSAACDSGDACDSGVCALGSADDGCGISYRAACRTGADACVSDDECGDPLMSCWPDSATGAWGCEDFCCCGRPLLVDGDIRVAGIVPRSDWCEAAGAATTGLDPDRRRALARHWGEAAQLEHASVASFARFSLELMAVGAPPDLLTAAQQAMADEIDHARRCFALASSYAEHAVGPAPLDVSQVAPATELEAVVRAVIDEACIGETLAAVEARAALSRATDDAVRESLEVIAADELRHAELGWRTLRWALEGCSAVSRARLRSYLTKAILDARRDLRSGEGVDDAVLAEHGKLSPRDRTRVLLNAIDTIVGPCATALLEALPAVA